MNKLIRLFLLMWLLSMLYSLSGVCAEREEFMTPWKAETVKSVLENRSDFHPFLKYQEREEWAKLQTNPRFSEGLKKILETAAQFKGKPLPELTASLYLDCQRTGRRTLFQNLQNERTRMLRAYALAECLEGKGNYLDPLMDAIWAHCEESDWCMPAHTAGLVDMELPSIDLRASRMAMELEQLLYVFGDALPKSIHKRVRYELERRIFEPYLQRDFGWLHTTNNWNAVCNGNILQAALYGIADTERLTKIITKAQNSMCTFLSGFDQDGGTAEGLGYWSYGFGNYVDIAHLLNLYTQKRLNLLEPPLVKEIAQFPMRAELSPGKYPSFSDGEEDYASDTTLLCYLADSLQLPQLRAFAAARMEKTMSVSGLDSIFYDGFPSPLPENAEPFQHENYTYFRGIQWMISRNDPADSKSLVLAVKGGSNEEPHNHNDSGNLIVHYRGESLIADLGAPVYDRDFFSAKRYTYLAARSLAHSVPLVNGCEQRAGSQTDTIAKATHTDAVDTLEMDITASYPPEAELEKLTRVVSLQRGGDAKLGHIELIDEAVFKNPAKSFESALITFGKITQPAENQLAFQGENGAVKITYDPTQFEIKTQEFDSAEAHLYIAENHPKIQRVAWVAKNPGSQIRLHLLLEPLP